MSEHDDEPRFRARRDEGGNMLPDLTELPAIESEQDAEAIRVLLDTLGEAEQLLSADPENPLIAEMRRNAGALRARLQAWEEEHRT